MEFIDSGLAIAQEGAGIAAAAMSNPAALVERLIGTARKIHDLCETAEYNRKKSKSLAKHISDLRDSLKGYAARAETVPLLKSLDDLFEEIESFIKKFQTQNNLLGALRISNDNTKFLDFHSRLDSQSIALSLGMSADAEVRNQQRSEQFLNDSKDDNEEIKKLISQLTSKVDNAANELSELHNLQINANKDLSDKVDRLTVVSEGNSQKESEILSEMKKLNDRFDNIAQNAHSTETAHELKVYNPAFLQCNLNKSSDVIIRTTTATVHRGKYGRVPVAVKTIKNLENMTTDSYELAKLAMHREAIVLQHHNDIPGVVQYFGTDNPTNPTTIVTELAHCTLDKLLHDPAYKDFLNLNSFEGKISILQDLCSTFAFFNSIGVLHRDIKTAHMLIMPNGQAKVGYFGFSKAKEIGSTAGTTMRGTHSYTCPELLLHTGNDKYKYSQSTDMYSFAIMMNEVLTGVKPFDFGEAKLIGLMYANSDARPALYSGTSHGDIDKDLRRLIQRGWRSDANQRITFEDLSSALNDISVMSKFLDPILCGVGVVVDVAASLNPVDLATKPLEVLNKLVNAAQKINSLFDSADSNRAESKALSDQLAILHQALIDYKPLPETQPLLEQLLLLLDEVEKFIVGFKNQNIAAGTLMIESDKMKFVEFNHKIDSYCQKLCMGMVADSIKRNSEDHEALSVGQEEIKDLGTKILQGQEKSDALLVSNIDDVVDAIGVLAVAQSNSDVSQAQTNHLLMQGIDDVIANQEKSQQLILQVAQEIKSGFADFVHDTQCIKGVHLRAYVPTSLDCAFTASQIMIRSNDSSIYKGKYSFIPVAIKTIKKLENITNDALKLAQLAIHREAIVLELHSIFPGVISYFGTDNPKCPTTIITELAHCTLKQLLYDSEFRSFRNLNSFPEKLSMLRELCSTFAYLNSYDVLHRDIKAANIMIMSDGHPKVSNFGFAKAKEIGSTAGTTLRGTHSYTCPELLKHTSGEKIQYSQATDMYSFAIMMNEVLTEKKPFDFGEARLIGLMYANEDTRPDLYPETSKGGNDDLRQMIQDGWRTHAVQRSTFAELLNSLNSFISSLK